MRTAILASSLILFIGLAVRGSGPAPKTRFIGGSIVSVAPDRITVKQNMTPPGIGVHPILTVRVTPQTDVWKGRNSHGAGLLRPGDDVHMEVREVHGVLYARLILFMGPAPSHSHASPKTRYMGGRVVSVARDQFTVKSPAPAPGIQQTSTVRVTPQTIVWEGMDSHGTTLLHPGDDVDMNVYEASGVLYASLIEVNIVNIYGIITTLHASTFTFAEYDAYPVKVRRACGDPNHALLIRTSSPTAVSDAATRNYSLSDLQVGQRLQIIGSETPGGSRVVAGMIFVLNGPRDVCGAP
ncbi:MAG: DUF5666 domain-containing protein [Terriglobia bacterium]